MPAPQVTPASKTAPQPKPAHARYANVPRELIERPQWVAWRFKQEPGENRPRKVLINPNTGAHASHSNPATWGSFNAALARVEKDSLPGVGYVFSADDPYFGADFDHCCNADSGEISPHVLAILGRLGTYTEVSPSGTGLHAIGRGVMPDNHKGRRNDDKGYECYDRKRYFTITGKHLASSPLTIEPRQDALDWHITTNFKAKVSKTKQPKSLPSEPLSTLSDEAIIARALQAKNGEKFGQLYAGSQLHYPTDSHADQALCDILAYWTKDHEQIDRLFRTSGRMWAKWERADYRQSTIDAALGYASGSGQGNTARSSVITLRLTVLSSPPNISGQFKGLAADACIAQSLGVLDCDTGEAPCVIPRHEGHLGAVFISRNGDVLYVCKVPGKPTWTLPQVRASRAYGHETRIKDESTGDPMANEHLVGRLLALHEAGRLDPLPILHLELPKSAPKAARRVYQGLVRLLGLKKHVWPQQQGTTFSWRFASAWCGINERTVQKGMAWLLARCFVLRFEAGVRRYGKRMSMFTVIENERDRHAAKTFFHQHDWKLEEEILEAIGDEPLDPEIMAIIEAMGSEVIA
jgi:hypothetical protein